VTGQAHPTATGAGPPPPFGLAGAWSAALAPRSVASARQRLASACEQRHTVVIAGHVAPDGDALGSALALHLALSAAGARTLPTIGEERLELEPALDRCSPGIADLVPPSALPPAASDRPARDRRRCQPRPSRHGRRTTSRRGSTRWCSTTTPAAPPSATALVAPDAAATVQLVALLLDELALPLTTDVATCLYVGLVTDTGRFSYAATDSSAHLLGARLLAAGVDQAAWSQRLFETRRRGDLTLLGAGWPGRLHRRRRRPGAHPPHRRRPGGRAGRQQRGPDRSAADRRGAEVALTLRPGRDGAWRGSLRSRGTVDVGRVAARSGAGATGWQPASTANGSAAEVVARVVACCGRPERMGRRPRPRGPVHDRCSWWTSPPGRPRTTSSPGSARGRAVPRRPHRHAGPGGDRGARGVPRPCDQAGPLPAGRARRPTPRRMVLGIETDTQDADGAELVRTDASHLDEATVCEALTAFQGRDRAGAPDGLGGQGRRRAPARARPAAARRWTASRARRGLLAGARELRGEQVAEASSS
jgi:bifunctional oligoribonuclease and PAP phosphatase NrnA